MTAILHVDGDNFFASCMAAKHPKYKGKPLVVGAERGMVTALSFEAKALGIKRGDPIFKIKEQYKNKEVIILHGDYEYFGKVSSRMHSIIESFTSNIEKYSIDESFADITEVVLKRNSTPEIIGREIKDKIQVSLGIPVSVGIAPTKTLAKLTSTSSKPDGFKVALKTPEIDAILDKTNIEKVWGIGRKTAIKLRVRGIYTAMDLKQIPQNMISFLGKPTKDIQNELRGIVIHNITKSHQLEHTMISSKSFEATNDTKFIKTEFARHIFELAKRLRDNSASAKTLTVHIRNINLETVGISSDLINHSESVACFLEEFDKMLPQIWNGNDKIKTTGAAVSNIIPSSFVTTSLFDGTTEKEKNIYETIDKINKKGIKVFTARLLK